MSTAIVLLNFGEPEDPTLEEVTAYLERIFTANASLEGHGTEEEVRTRSRELARRRAPGLLETYREIGGSPLNAQARAQAEALEAELRRRGVDARCHVGMQFTERAIVDAVERARAEGADRLVGLPVYPLCGRSTTVAALEELSRTVRGLGWDVELREVGGWHRHPDYLEFRADAIRRGAEDAGVDLRDPATRLVFSAHGTPIRYLDEGSRYDRYVEEWCRAVAERLGVAAYTLGFQNHANRGVEWTRPDIEDAIRRLAGGSEDQASGPRGRSEPEGGTAFAPARVERVVVDAASFMHEQSETLSELDRELREEAEEAGLEFHRVPVPWDDPRFASVLADLAEPLLAGREPQRFRLADCRCRPGASCLNAAEQPVFAAMG